MKINEKNIKEIQGRLLEILVYFRDFCDEHGLGFVLAGGTCLGAVRHGGFIPWDDDIDVFMLREDYEKLKDLWEHHADTSRYSYLRSDQHLNIRHSATEIKDNNTTFINSHSRDLDMHHGLMIDVIPLDGVARGLSKYYQIYRGLLFCGYNFQRLPQHKGGLTYFITKIGLSLVRSDKRRYRIWKKAEDELSKYSVENHDLVASFGEGLRIMRQTFPKEWFINPSYLDFEGYSMPVPSDTHSYLEISYGSYMELPPEDQRQARHDISFMDLDNGYTKYRGTEYFTEKKGQ